MKLQAFHNNAKFKAQMIAAAISHRQADEYISGEYSRVEGDVFKGCSVGCSLYDVKKIRGVKIADYSDHARLAKELGVPLFIATLQDKIYEMLPQRKRYDWTERLFQAIPVGVDLSPVLPRFLKKTLDRLPKTNSAEVNDAIAQAKDILTRWAETGEVDLNAASAARNAASAARSAASAASAAWCAESAASAASAAWSAESAARSAASAERKQIADDLIACIVDCEVNRENK